MLVTITISFLKICFYFKGKIRMRDRKKMPSSHWFTPWVLRDCRQGCSLGQSPPPPPHVCRDQGRGVIHLLLSQAVSRKLDRTGTAGLMAPSSTFPLPLFKDHFCFKKHWLRLCNSLVLVEHRRVRKVSRQDKIAYHHRTYAWVGNRV